MTELAYSLGDFFQSTFGILIALGNIPNYLFIILGFVGLFYWLNLQKKYSREDKEAGRLI
mgnify:CR=1 FL=1|jgi:hypothetical protein